MKLNVIFVFLILFVSCEKTEKSTKTNEVLSPNKIVSLTIDKQEYMTARNSELVIVPVIIRENEQTDERLEFKWFMKDQLVSKERNLNYIIPNQTAQETIPCSFYVYDKANEKEHKIDFKVKVINPFGYGYYFLAADEMNNSMLFHINCRSNSDVVFNTSAIDGCRIGSDPKMLTRKQKYDPSSVEGYYQINIVTGNGEYPYIKTNNQTFGLDDKLYYKTSDVLFAPSFHQVDRRDMEFFINNGQHVIYDRGVLYFPHSAETAYNWSNPIEGRNGKHIYVLDKETGKYYLITAGSDSYHYDKVIPIINSPTLKEERVIGYYWKLVRLVSGDLVEEISMITTSTGRLNYYQLTYDGTTPTMTKLKSEVVNGANDETTTTVTDNGLWYIGIGNNLYTLTSLNDPLKLFLTIPEQHGSIVKMINSSDSKKLIVATYDRTGRSVRKGSILILDTDSKQIATYPNSITKCVSIIDCNL